MIEGVFSVDGLSLGMSESDVIGAGFISLSGTPIGSPLTAYRRAKDAQSTVTISDDKVIEVLGETLSLNTREILKVGDDVDRSRESVLQALSIPAVPSREEALTETPPDAIFLFWCGLEVYFKNDKLYIFRLADSRTSGHRRPGEVPLFCPVHWSIDEQGHANLLA